MSESSPAAERPQDRSSERNRLPQLDGIGLCERGTHDYCSACGTSFEARDRVVVAVEAVDKNILGTCWFVDDVWCPGCAPRESGDGDPRTYAVSRLRRRVYAAGRPTLRLCGAREADLPVFHAESAGEGV